MALDFNSVFSGYLEKHTFSEFGKELQLSFFPEIYVVIPCYDEGDIHPVLHSLKHAFQGCDLSICVICVVNSSENTEIKILQNNKITIKSIQTFTETIKDIKNFQVAYIDAAGLPVKEAGVGLARKIGMDAVIYFCKEYSQDSVILCLDADSLCSENYFTAIHKSFIEHPKWDAASIHFEHPIESKEYSTIVIKAITDYELHLRLFVGFQKWLRLPYAIQTIGSSMAVRASSYCLSGGMNKKKAGEDFYFLHKIGDKGIMGEIFSTTVIPSPRISHRVPFGTGKAVGNVVENNVNIKTYNPDSFIMLKKFTDMIPLLYTHNWPELSATLPTVVVSYLESIDIEKNINECRKYVSSQMAFIKRFYQWFNAFKLMKYCHFCRDQGMADVNVLVAFFQLNKNMNYVLSEKEVNESKTALLIMRKFEKKSENK